MRDETTSCRRFQLGATHVPVRCVGDVVQARGPTRTLAQSMGMSVHGTAAVDAATGELRSKVPRDPQHGATAVSGIGNHAGRGLEVARADCSPAVADVPAARRDEYFTGGGPGIGLGSMDNAMDESGIHSQRHEDTLISIRDRSTPADGCSSRPSEELE